MSLNFVAMGLYVIAATGGLIMALRIFQEKPSPAILAILHLAFTGAGSLTLATFIFSGTVDSLFTLALVLYVIAALGGLFLGSFRFRDSYPPKAVVVIHAGVAVAGTLTLLMASF